MQNSAVQNSGDSYLMTYRSMTTLDLFNCNNINLDAFTENFNTSFYLNYIAEWPELCIVAEASDGTMAGYIIGKMEGTGTDWHGHVTALSVAPEFRSAGVASRLMQVLEEVSDKFNCYFVDLFVRSTNDVAVSFYKKLDYEIYQIVKGYYSGGEDAYDMRKCLSRDTKRSSLINPDRCFKKF